MFLREKNCKYKRSANGEIFLLCCLLGNNCGLSLPFAESYCLVLSCAFGTLGRSRFTGMKACTHTFPCNCCIIILITGWVVWRQYHLAKVLFAIIMIPCCTVLFSFTLSRLSIS